MVRQHYKIACAYDTETTTIGDDATAIAYPVLWICNDLRNIDISEYHYGESDDIRLYRTEQEMHGYLKNLIDWGRRSNIVPIVAAYNLMFDLTPLMGWLAENYDLTTSAQTTTSVYTMDVHTKGGNPEYTLLRFWDTFYLEQGGLKAMGETCGLPKAVGDWDYSLVRTPETPLTPRERHYAGRDTQVIPAYLRYLLDANPWMTEQMFGHTILTKTSIVRQMAKHEIGNRKISYVDVDGGERIVKLEKVFNDLCVSELAKDYKTYALRKACFRGGLTFTAANYASREVHDVASLDVTSMHHTYINGRMVPVGFKRTVPATLTRIVKNIMTTSVEAVLKNYHEPFIHAFHARVRLTNLRLKAGSPFEKWGIALLSQSKFDSHSTRVKTRDARDVAALDAMKKHGYKDEATNPVFAYGKLMSADVATVFVNEIEAWNIGQVYDYDSIEALEGETATRFIAPPAYVSLQSNILFERKQVIKHILKDYRTGEPYKETIPGSVPDGIASQLRDGSLSRSFLQSYYQSTVKGSFNAIYGTQAQDIFKPGFIVLSDGTISVDKSSVPEPENYRQLYRHELGLDRPHPVRRCKVLYTYGMRIVAGSRMHLIISILSLWRALGTRAIPTGGDTDSLKVACDRSVTDAELVDAEKPIADASDHAIDRAQAINRNLVPSLCSTLRPIGHFDLEDCGPRGVKRYRSHMEAWNKARVSLDIHGRIHVTIAGLARPAGTVTIEDALTALHRCGLPFAACASIIGYDVTVLPSLSHSLEKARPKAGQRYIGLVTDYCGIKTPVAVPRSIALYPAARVLGDRGKMANSVNLKYLQKIGHAWKQPPTEITYENKEIQIWQNDRIVARTGRADFTTGNELSPMTRR